MPILDQPANPPITDQHNNPGPIYQSNNDNPTLIVDQSANHLPMPIPDQFTNPMPILIRCVNTLPKRPSLDNPGSICQYNANPWQIHQTITNLPIHDQFKANRLPTRTDISHRAEGTRTVGDWTKCLNGGWFTENPCSMRCHCSTDPCCNRANPRPICQS